MKSFNLNHAIYIEKKIKLPRRYSIRCQITEFTRDT